MANDRGGRVNVIRDLPFSDKGRSIVAPNGIDITIKPNQIVLFACIRPPGHSLPSRVSANLSYFPILLDVGLNVSCAMRQEHFDQWTGCSDYLGVNSTTSINGHSVTVYGANFWLFRNVPRSMERIELDNPTRIELREGICVYNAIRSSSSSSIIRRFFSRSRSKHSVAMGDSVPGPRIPTLGLSVFPHNRLNLEIEGFKRLCHITASR